MEQTKSHTTHVEAGRVITFYAGVATISGLPHVFIHEVLNDESGNPVAVVIGFTKEHVEALFIDNAFDVTNLVYRSRQQFSISVSDAYIGRIVDGLSRPLDGFSPIPKGTLTSVFLEAPPIIHRKPVSRPLTTGIKVIDTTLPLGRGQRELIIGDRKLGKSTIATDIVLNQKNASDTMYCVYVSCGQRLDKLDELTDKLEASNAFLYTTVVGATAADSYLAQYLAPFVGCTIAEHFRNTGRDALVIYDDLTKHAKVYRDISLILERVPGREAYPGDIFALHATLLERAAQLSDDQSGGSLTALPIIETLEGDVTAFIPTNIISITDGQIYLERGLFQKHFLPAVNVGLSVSRVGSQVQPRILKEVVGGLRLALAQHKELQKLSQLETTVSEIVRQDIHRGNLLLELLKQDKHTFVSFPEQVVLFFAVESGYFDDFADADWAHFMNYILELFRSRHQKVLTDIQAGVFDEVVKRNIKQVIREFKDDFVTNT
jgi:F-type H+-transporting ATPase subunit alpha